MNDTASAMVLYEDPSFLIVDKRAGIPTVPLKESPPDEPTLLGQIGELFPEVLTVNGRNGWEGGVLHRLDTPTSGLVVIARTDAAYQRLLSISQGGLFIKEYQAKSSAKERVMQSTFPPIRTRIPCTAGAVRSPWAASFATGASIAVRCARCSATARATSSTRAAPPGI